MTPTPSVQVKDLTVRFGNFTAVSRVSFSVNKGEIFGFLGANGAGKTTTIRVLCGLLLPTDGEVWVAGKNLSEGTLAIKSSVGYMSQKFTLYDDLTIQENLNFAASLRKLPPAYFKQRTQELLDFIEFQRKTNVLVRDLPGGIKQQISLVTATLHDPEIVFLDEPTAGVTPAARARFWALIRKIADAGKTVFVTTHYMDEAEQCGRIALMRAGEIIALDTPAKLKEQTFREPLFEVELTGEPPNDWKEQIRAQGVLSLQPYGMRYHATVGDLKAFEMFTAHSDFFSSKRIQPSLEDVFIRLVEGDNR